MSEQDLPYEPGDIEEEVQRYWLENNTFSVTEDPSKEKFYLFKYVSLSKWFHPHGSCKKLFNWRCYKQIPKNAR